MTIPNRSATFHYHRNLFLGEILKIMRDEGVPNAISALCATIQMFAMLSEHYLESEEPVDLRKLIGEIIMVRCDAPESTMQPLLGLSLEDLIRVLEYKPHEA